MRCVAREDSDKIIKKKIHRQNDQLKQIKINTDTPGGEKASSGTDMKKRHDTTKSRHAAAQLLLPYISYLIYCAGGFLGPVHCVILSWGRWHSHTVNRIPWIQTVEEESPPGAASSHARISRFG